MIYEIDNFKISPKDNLDEKVLNKYKTNKYKILRRSIDARKKEDVKVIYKLAIDTPLNLKNEKKYVEEKISLDYPKWNKKRPVVIGFGPPGIFASLYLARCGANPIIVERGSTIEKRVENVNDFLNNKKLNPNSNVQFGEGGAGTFSDGKLTTNVKNPLIKFILNEFYIHGAHEDILYEAKPHIGTDVLRIVVENIRKEIISLGGTFYFDHQFLDVKKINADLEVYVSNLEPIITNDLLLCIGHSARDTIKHLYNDLKIEMEPKAFSMGVRVEHPANLINESQYGKFYKDLPPAYYNLACHLNNRGIYTFCMCPGGYVLASASEPNTIVTNGMSNNKRDNINSNSAILVDVLPKDYYKTSVLDGLDYQEKYEKKAFEISGDYKAPANLIKEFLNGDIANDFRSVKTTYPHGVKFADLSKCLPDFVIEGLKGGIKEFDKKLKGFAYDDGILIGIESRSSSPVRIKRDENYETSIKGIYPVGEGAGYAGGITSAALDGLKVAMKIAKGGEND